MPQFRDPNEKREFMLNTPVSRLVPKMALPSIAGMLVTSAYNLADTLFVSQLGTNATGAVGVNGSIDLIIMMAGSLLAVGAASLTARLLGAKQDERAREVLSTCFFIAFALGCVVLAAGFAFQEEILLLLGANEDILPYSEQYCRYILLAAPFMATSFVLNQCLRAEGSAVFSMIGMMAGAVLNIGLDPLFIFTFGWGVAGASAATAISKVVSWCILMTPYLRKKTLLAIRLCHFRPHWADAKEVCAMGSASFFRTGLGTLAGILLNRIAVTYGTSALAAINVSNRITMFMTSACLGFGQGFQPVAGFSWGAKRYDRVRESFRFSLITCVAGISAVGMLVGIFARPILLLFTENDAELVHIGVLSLRTQCLAMPFHGFCIIVNMLCSGIGQALPSLLLGLSRQGICFFPILPVMVRLWGVQGIAAVQGVADMLSLLLAAPIAIRISRDIRRREAGQGGETAVSA